MKFSSQPTIALRVNGASYDSQVDARTTLLDLLREHRQLTGTKKGCNFGECGACTVHLNGRRVNACLVLAAAELELVAAVWADGAGADHSIVVERNEDLAAATYKVGTRIGELHFVGGFHEMILVEPLAIQIPEALSVLRSKCVDRDVHGHRSAAGIIYCE
jgi:hypothetical protein